MIYQISSGQGPAECELGAAKFLEHLQKYHGVSVVDTSAGYREGTLLNMSYGYTQKKHPPYTTTSTEQVGGCLCIGGGWFTQREKSAIAAKALSINFRHTEA